MLLNAEEAEESEPEKEEEGGEEEKEEEGEGEEEVSIFGSYSPSSLVQHHDSYFLIQKNLRLRVFSAACKGSRTHTKFSSCKVR